MNKIDLSEKYSQNLKSCLQKCEYGFNSRPGYKVSEVAAIVPQLAYTGSYTDLKAMHKIPSVTIYQGKKWYVGFSLRNPYTGKIQRFQKYGEINAQPTKALKIEHAKALKKAIEELLANGWSPFEVQAQNTITYFVHDLERVLIHRKSYQTISSFQGGVSRLNVFLLYLKNKGLHEHPSLMIGKGLINQFLEHLINEKQVKPTTRNNYLRELKSLFSQLEEWELVPINPCKGIKMLQQRATKNAQIQPNELAAIKKWLLANDPNLYNYIRFITYAFLRPIEVSRLMVGNIDLENRILHVPTKTKAQKSKYIVDALYDYLRSLNLQNYRSTNFIFTPNGIPGPWQRSELGRRTYFTERFWKAKQKIELNENVSLYSFRHTFISDLYRNYREALGSEHEAKLKLMQITGHESFAALDAYLREVEAFIPRNFGNDFSLEF